MISDRERLLAYLAGFFDGEGCIIINRGYGTSYYLLSAAVSNTKPEVLHMYRDTFGGTIVKSKRGENCKDIYQWSVDARKAEEFLLAMRGRLILKAAQLELALTFRELFKGPNILPRGNAFTESGPHREKTDNVLAQRRNAYLRMRKLNQRGVPV